MIILDFHNPALEELLLTRFYNAKAGLKLEKIDYTVADFDRVLYRIHNPDKDKTKLLVSLLVSFFDELREYDVEMVLKREYGAYMLDQPFPGYSVTLCFDLTNVPDDYDSLAHRVALMKRHCFAAVFEPFFLLQALADEPIVSKRAVIHYSPDEAMYVQALEDRITVIFSTVFKDADDVVIGKIFMQEFTEVRRRYDRAPQVLYSHREPPAELRGTDAVGGDNRAYITFVLFPRHLAPNAADRTINLIHTVRNYLHYHIKCSKGYLQLRMRSKTSEFIKILNRAVPTHQQFVDGTGDENAEPAVFVHALGLESSAGGRMNRHGGGGRKVGNSFGSDINMLMPSTLSQSDFACMQKFEDSDDEEDRSERNGDGDIFNSFPPAPSFDA
nr:actin protein 2:3 complex subunit 2 [Hymenolepis microstoma]